MAVDLGTANTLAAAWRGSCSTSLSGGRAALRRPLAVGADAKRMIGCTPAHIEAIRPSRTASSSTSRCARR
ncbi:MAG: rod shape-determining protein [Microthrixaceae bacterium]